GGFRFERILAHDVDEQPVQLGDPLLARNARLQTNQSTVIEVAHWTAFESGRIDWPEDHGRFSGTNVRSPFIALGQVQIRWPHTRDNKAAIARTVPRSPENCRSASSAPEERCGPETDGQARDISGAVAERRSRSRTSPW